MMLGGILPFLIQWLALSHFGSVLLNPNPLPYSAQYPESYASPYPAQSYSHSNYYGNSAPSQWKLLNEFANLAEDEIEKFLPQICNILLDYETMNDPRLIEQYERIVIDKCANCLPFGIKVCNLLKVSRCKDSSSYARVLNVYGNCTAGILTNSKRRIVQELIPIEFQCSRSSRSIAIRPDED
jgi:hypothetical protein